MVIILTMLNKVKWKPSFYLSWHDEAHMGSSTAASQSVWGQLCSCGVMNERL